VGLLACRSPCRQTDVVVGVVMPYLTNNQRLDLGLVGASCVKEETLEAAKPEGYYVEGAKEKPAKPAAKKTAKK